MPLYEYHCDQCHHRFELIQRFSDPPPSACPKCGGHVRKLLSSPAIQFKGSGWYVTDYARKGGTGDVAGAKGPDGKDTSAPDGGKAAGGDAATSAPAGSGGSESAPPKTETK